LASIVCERVKLVHWEPERWIVSVIVKAVDAVRVLKSLFQELLEGGWRGNTTIKALWLQASTTLRRTRTRRKNVDLREGKAGGGWFPSKQVLIEQRTKFELGLSCSVIGN